MKITGFRAYTTYLFVKNIHFKDNDYNVMRLNDIPMKDKLLNNWNKKRRKQDGIKFREIEEECNDIRSLAFLYSSYYIKNKNFYIQDIFEDGFEDFYNNSQEIRHFDELYQNDFMDLLNYCKDEQIKPQHVFFSKTEIPKVFGMNLSMNSLVVLNDLFNIIDGNKKIKINVLEQEKWEDLKITIKKYKLIIKDRYDKYNFKEITKKCLTDG